MTSELASKDTPHVKQFQSATWLYHLISHPENRLVAEADAADRGWNTMLALFDRALRR